MDILLSASARPDFATIARWIKPKARVLDLGCGDGSLICYLQETRGSHGYGVEISDSDVFASVKAGVNVLQDNLETDLSIFESNSFDYVILSQTLQAVKNTERIINEMLRVGKEGIATFPNFGYWRNRLQILQGKMPVSETLPYQWFETPNIHLFTIKDFEVFCHDHGVRILERVAMTNGEMVSLCPNLLGSLAVYRFDRQL